MTSRKSYKEDQDCLAEIYLAAARQNLPVVGRVLGEQGDETLEGYLAGFAHEPQPSYQTRDDLLDLLRVMIERLLDEKLARSATHDLARFPVVLTASHHGVDSISQSFQGNLLFMLNAWRRGGSARTVCVFSCGNIPLNNSEYPRGLLFYHLHPERNGLTMKFPIFPDRLKRCMVSVTPGFNAQMIERAVRKLDRMVHQGQLSQQLEVSLRQVLQNDYNAQSVLALPTYSEQSVVLNHRIWKKLISAPAHSQGVIYIELEKIVGALLKADLLNSDSLAGCVMFDPMLRDRVLEELDGKRGCWRREELARGSDFSGGREKSPQGYGTVFFWGVDEHRRRVPLHLKADSSGNLMLAGIDDQGQLFQLPFTAKSLIEALEDRRLLPSLFTCFLTLSFARGLVCVGGYFQAEYLPVMQQGLMRALKGTKGYQNMLPFVSNVVTDRYLSGMQAVMRRADEDHLIPAGPLEIIAGGGISRSDIEKIMHLKVREAHLAGLFETAPDGVPQELRPAGWERQLARECSALLGNRVVVK